MSMRKQWTILRDYKARKMRQQGMTGKQIAEALGVADSTVYRKLKSAPQELFDFERHDMTYSDFCEGRAMQERGASYDDIAKALRITLQKAVNVYRPFVEPEPYFWTAERQAMLMHYKDAGHSNIAIAEALGTSDENVGKQVYELYSLLAKYDHNSPISSHKSVSIS